MLLTEYTFSALEHPNLIINVLFQKSVSNSNITCQGLEECQKNRVDVTGSEKYQLWTRPGL